MLLFTAAVKLLQTGFNSHGAIKLPEPEVTPSILTSGAISVPTHITLYWGQVNLVTTAALGDNSGFYDGYLK